MMVDGFFLTFFFPQTRNPANSCTKYNKKAISFLYHWLGRQSDSEMEIQIQPLPRLVSRKGGVHNLCWQGFGNFSPSTQYPPPVELEKECLHWNKEKSAYL